MISPMGSGYFSGPKPRLYGHRGAAARAPENTLESFRRAIEDGAKYLELDVHATSDGVVVVIHDSTLERTTDGSGEIRKAVFRDLRGIDAGYRFEIDGTYPFRGRGVRVPSLQELLAELPGVPLNVEIKQAEPPIEAEVKRLLDVHGAGGHVVLAAELDVVMARIRTAAPEVATSASAGEAREFFERFFGERLGGYRPEFHALQIPTFFGDIELVTPATIAAAHELGLEMHVWTINDPREMERLLRLGVDGLMSDDPALLVTVAGRLAGERSRW